RLLRRCERVLVPGETVVQHRRGPVDEAQSLALTAALHVLDGGLGQARHFSLPALERGERQGTVGRDAAADDLGDRLGLPIHPVGLAQPPTYQLPPPPPSQAAA